MKKETIEKIFRKYIGIYDNIVFEKTEQHLPEKFINNVYSQIDNVFNEYETIENTENYTNFSKKIINIINNVLNDVNQFENKNIENASKQAYEDFLKHFIINDDNVLEYVDNEMKKMEENAIIYGVIPYNPYFDLDFNNGALRKYKDKFNVKIENINSLRTRQERIGYLNIDEWYKENPENKVPSSDYEILKNTIHDYPLMFTKETLEKYEDCEVIEDHLYLCSNSVKNDLILQMEHDSAFIQKLKEYKGLSGYDYRRFDYQKVFQNYIYDKTCNYNGKTWYQIAQLKDSRYYDGTYSKIYEFSQKELMNEIQSKHYVINEFDETILNIIQEILAINPSTKYDASRYYGAKYILENNIDDVSIIRLGNILKGLLLNKDKFSVRYLKKLLNALLKIVENEYSTIKYDEETNTYITTSFNIINAYYEKVQNNADFLKIIDIQTLEKCVNTLENYQKYKFVYNIKDKINTFFKKLFKKNKN